MQVESHWLDYEEQALMSHFERALLGRHVAVADERAVANERITRQNCVLSHIVRLAPSRLRRSEHRDPVLGDEGVVNFEVRRTFCLS